jgi:hypothetical protein
MEPLGPVATADAAVELLDTTTVDAAILDIRLQNGRRSGCAAPHVSC